jgi:hypothetical protein
MKYIVISGDVVSSTSLSVSDKDVLRIALDTLLEQLKDRYGVYGRLLKGDYIECVVPSPSLGLEVLLAIKSYVKNIPIAIDGYKEDKKRAKLFKEYGIRLAMGYGELAVFDEEKGIIDGEAIYLSGRLINSKSTHDKARVVIKNTLYFASNDPALNSKWTAFLELLDVLLNKATERQSEVVYHKLLGLTEDAIAQKLDVNQSVVNRHSTSVGWNAIETTVSYYKATFKN